MWLVHNLISNIVPKKMGVPLVWRLTLAHYVPKIGKSNKMRCLDYLTPDKIKDFVEFIFSSCVGYLVGA